MVPSLAIALVSTSFLFVVLSYVVGVERYRRERIILSQARFWLDSIVTRSTHIVELVVRYIYRHIIKLSWYYSLHSLLQTALRVVVSLYDYLERVFHLNRKKARAIRAERRIPKEPSGMLHSVALHKETTALSPGQKKKLRTKKLERE